MGEVYCSTGAFIGRPNGRDFRLIPKLAPSIDCDGFEFMMYNTWYGDEVELLKVLESSGLRFATFHIEKTIGELLAKEEFSEAEKRFEVNCRLAKDIGSTLAVMHLWNGQISDSNIEANFSALPRLRQISEKYGILLTVENVVANGDKPLNIWKKLLVEHPYALLTYDTKMADFDNDNWASFLPENLYIWKNVRHLHINDRLGGYRDWSAIRSMNIGNGNINFVGFFRGLKSVGYSGNYTVESNAFLPNGQLDLDSLNQSISSVRELAKILQ